MADRFVFADEAGNFDFSRNKGASRYFILTTVTMDDCRTGDALADLRRSLTWQGINLPRPFMRPMTRRRFVTRSSTS